MSNKNIIILAEKGNTGKSYIGSNIIEQLRLSGNQCAAYLLDKNAIGGLDRLGQKDKFGVPLKEQDPLIGIKQFDISNQEEIADTVEAKKEAEYFINSLRANYPYSVYDFPGQSKTIFANLFEKGRMVDDEWIDGELPHYLKKSKKEYFIVMPVSCYDSLSHIKMIVKLFCFNGDYVELNDKIKFVVIHNPTKETPELSVEEYKKSDTHKELLGFGDRYKFVSLAHIDTAVIKLLTGHPFSHFYDVEEDDALNVPKEFEGRESIFEKKVSKIFTGKQGFPNIVKNTFIDWKND